jgi:phage nucleotide-binding protein
MQIQKTNNLANQYLKIMPFGPSGVGKTRLAGSMSLRVKTLILSAESGLLSLQNLKDENGLTPNIDYVQINNFADMEAAYHHLKNVKHDYKGVAIDSLTEIQKACKDAIMEQTKKDAMEMRDWGVLAHKIERMVRAFRDLPMHVIVTALDDSEADKITGEIKVWPALQGSVQKQLPAYFDIVLYTFTREVGEGSDRKTVYSALTQNSGKYIAKDRSGKLPKVLDDPTFGKIYDLIFPSTTTKEK